MPKAIDIKNQKFGFLKAVKPTLLRDSSGSIEWQCECICGNKVNVSSRLLKSGNNRSCGCKRDELAGNAISFSKIKHGGSYSYRKGGMQLDYSLWIGIKKRCYNENEKNYYRYGGRGIKVCKQWKNNFEEFAYYIRSLPECPTEEVLTSRGLGKRLKVSIDRINNNKNYKPGNIRWSDNKKQANNKSSNVIVKYKGNKMTLMECCEKYSIVSYKTVHLRINRSGWPLEKALMTPSRIRP